MKQQFIEEYESQYGLYEETVEKMRPVLAELCQRNTFHIHLIAGRIKEISSLTRKITGSPHKYQSLADVTDVCGMRVITYYEDEVDQIAALIRRDFAIDEANCVDKRALLPASSFGYAAVHLILVLPGRCKIEVQICSILQHAWAEIEHDLLYKNKAAEGYAARRCFSRLAGLLEVADVEFIKLRQAIAADSPRDLGKSRLRTYMRPFSVLLPPALKEPRSGRASWLPFAAAWFMVAAVVFSALTTIHFGNQVLQIAGKLSMLLTDV